MTTPAVLKFAILSFLLWTVCCARGLKRMTSSPPRETKLETAVDVKTDKIDVITLKEIDIRGQFFVDVLSRKLRAIAPSTKSKQSDYDKFGDYEGMQVDQPMDDIGDSGANINNSSEEISKKSDSSSYDLKRIDNNNKNVDKNEGLQMDAEAPSSSLDAWKVAARLGRLDATDVRKVDCIPTSQDTLSLMLGAAFNSRYMSIGKPSLRDNQPVSAGHKADGATLHDEAQRPKKSSHPSEAFAVNNKFSRILYDEPTRRTRRSAKRHHHSKDKHHHQNEEKTWSTAHHKKTASPGSTEIVDSWIDHLPPVYSGDAAVERFLDSIRRSRSVSSGPPWHCESRVQWIDLGRQFFPRYLRTTECTAEKCWYGNFRCQARAFTVKLLRRRKDSCEIDAKRDAIDHRIPVSMQEEWVFEERAVTFCCECVM